MSRAQLDWREIEQALEWFFRSQGASVEKDDGDLLVEFDEYVSPVSLTELAHYLAEHIGGAAP
jgi:hypothetical protein